MNSRPSLAKGDGEASLGSAQEAALSIELAQEDWDIEYTGLLYLHRRGGVLNIRFTSKVVQIVCTEKTAIELRALIKNKFMKTLRLGSPNGPDYSGVQSITVTDPPKPR